MARGRNLGALAAWPLSAAALVAAGLFGPANILGAVSQSGGIPTGAIIESGTTATGDYTKYADGTLICSLLITNTDVVNSAATGMYIGATFNWTFPAAFATPPVVIGAAKAVSTVSFLFTNATNVGSCSYFNGALSAQASKAYSTWLFAKGRWF